MFKVNNENTRTMSLSSSKYFTPFSNVSTVEFEQVNVNWVGIVNFLQVSCHVSENDMKWNT